MTNKTALENSLMMRAARREPVERTPIWLMRQAGRYMSEYREVRDRTTFLDLCKSPKLCAEVMLTAVERLGVDAAIIFSDILPLLEPMGMQLRYEQGEGPVIDNPIRTAGDLKRFNELEDVSALDFVYETVRLTREGLSDDLPVIGFSGAPFTLASYAIEGGGSRNYLHTKKMMFVDEFAWHDMMGRLARTVARYLNAQIDAGAQIVQLFDSWAGTLGPHEYAQFVLPHMQTLFGLIKPGVPVIHFAAGNPALLPLVSRAGGDVIGVDWRIPLDIAWHTIGFERAIQGNLDPAMLLTDETQCFAFCAGHESFAAAEGAIGLARSANKARQTPLKVVLNGLGKDAAHIISRINGFTHVQTEFNYATGELKIVWEKAYSDGERAKVRCYGADDVREGVAIMAFEDVDVAITGNSTNPTRFQHPVMATYKKECIDKGKKFFSVASGGGTGRTLHPDNMAAGPASYGMTDTMGRMHSDAQFAGSSSVPAHVEMMGLIGMGNNPMVGASVAVAVAIEKAMTA